MIYQEPQLYEIVYAEGSAEEAQTLARLARRWKLRSPVLEPACGAGRVMRPLARRGFSVTGVDWEEEMIRRGRDSVRGKSYQSALRFVQGDMRKLDSLFKASAFDWAYNLIGSVRHLMSERDLQAHFRSISKVLKPQALYFVGINLCGDQGEKTLVDHWTGARGTLKVRLRVEYQPGPARREKVWSHIRWRTPSRRGEHRSFYWLRSYTWDQWQKSLSRSGFSCEAVLSDEGKTTHRKKGHFIFVLKNSK